MFTKMPIKLTFSSRLLIIALVLNAILGEAQAKAALSADEEKLAAANNSFAFALLKQISLQQPATNIFISPYSASLVLQMIDTGAAGQTKKEMDHVLGIDAIQPPSLNSACKELDQSIRSLQTNVALTLANAIWYRPGTELLPEFSAANQQYFSAALNMLDFTDPRAAGIINKWADENTRGKIKKIIDPPIPGYYKVFLANAIYFKGTWLDQFDQKQTRNLPFHLPDGTQKQVPLMQQKGHFSYQDTKDFQAIRLPYAGKRLGMFVLLPHTNSHPQKLTANLAAAWKTAILPKFLSQEGTIALPRFKLEYATKLKPILQAMGMRLPFEESADFSRMSSSRLYVDEVKQMSFVEVNEEGTEAAAVTLGTMKTTAILQPTKPFEMIVDRPFLFLIEDNLTHSLLFMGVIVEP